MMPILFTIIGLGIGMKFGKAFKSGLYVGVGFIGLGVVTALLTSNFNDPLKGISEIYHLQLNVFDMGWPAAAAVAYNTAVGALIIPICLGVNFLMLITKTGTAKKVSYESFKDVRRSGIIAIKLSGGDELQTALRVRKGESVILATAGGQSIRFDEKDIREMGRTAGGVRAMKLGESETIVGADVVMDEKTSFLLVMGANGLGKKTALSEYKIQKRGGSGIKTAKVTPKTGKLMVGKIVQDGMELVAMSKKGQVIRVDLAAVPSSGRQTQGVHIMKLRPGDEIASVTCL